MVDVPDMTRQQVTLQAPDAVQPAQQPTGGIQTIAHLLDAVSGRIEDRLDLTAKIEASRAGALAGANGMPSLQDETTISGQAFNMAARDAVATRMDLAGRKALAQYETDHMQDPAGFQKKASDYLNGALKGLAGFDPVLAQKYSAEYQLQAQNAFDRIKQRHLAVVSDQQTESALQLVNAVDADQGGLAGTLFSTDPQNVTKVLGQMVTNAARIKDVAHSMGANGQPLFDAAQRVRMSQAAEQSVSKNIGLAWLNRQADPAAALDAWKNGKAVIDIADDKGNKGQLNLQQILGPEGYAAAQKSFIDNYRSQLALENAQNAAQDHTFKKQSDAIYSDLAASAQQGILPLSLVEASKDHLDPDKYLNLRAMALKGGASVTNGPVMSDLIARDAQGEDIRGQLRDGYSRGLLTLDDFNNLYQRNSQRMDAGVQQPVSVGRDYVSNSLGNLSKQLGMPQSVQISKADAEYAQSISDFIAKNNRQPSTSEAISMGQDVVRRYSVMDMTSTILNLPLPMMMTPAQKFTGDLSTKTINDTAARTSAHFLQLHNGDKSATQADPAYQSEMSLLKQYADIVKIKEGNNNADPAAK